MLTCGAFAQVIYPSNVTTTLTPPYSIYLDEYSNPLTPKIKANIVFTDFTEASWDVYLKLKITGSNFTIESKPGIKPPQPVNVVPGVPFQLSGADLDWYFNNNNLIFSGITRAKLDQLNDVLKQEFLDDFVNHSEDALKRLQDDNLFEVWKNDIRSSSLDELSVYKNKGNLRNEYIASVNSIADEAKRLKSLNKSDMEIAQEVFNLRRQTTINFKHATPDDMLDLIYEFNDIRYTKTGLGDKWGLSWEGAVAKATKNNVTDYSRIISGASTPLGDKQALGKALYDIVGSKTLPILKKYRMTSLIQ
jgi:hypothetical protein